MGGHRRRRSRFSEEAGFALIEALIGAVVLIAIALATLAAIDRAQKTSAFAKDKSVAAALAEQDQARLRGLPADSLSNYGTNHTASRTVTVNGLNYTVASTVNWVRDSTGATLSCTNNGTSQADYFQLTSTVSGTGIQPVTITSLSAPPLSYSSSRGTLVVQVNDGATPAVGVQGVGVTIDGPVDQSATTNALGCAVFSFIPAGAYDVGIARTGYVDYGGTNNPHQNKTVAGASLTTATFIYDAAGSIDVNFETDISTTATPSISASRGYNASAFNTLVPAPQFRTASDPSAPVATVTLSTLFPFRTAYNTYAGTCATANPKTAIPNANWFNSGNIGFDDNAIVPPGNNVAVTVRQPALKVRVKNDLGTYINGANVTITQSGTGCAPASLTGWTTVKHPLANTDGWITKPAYNFGGSTGNVPYDPGVPFGTYTVCADAITGTGTNQRRRKAYSSPVTINSAAGTAGTDIQISTTSSTTASCP
jgi:Tfp pilus assembly protein PilV